MENTKVSLIIDQIFLLVEQSIKQSQRGYFWKQRALRVAKKVFKNRDINVDYLVEFLTKQQKKDSPRDMNIVALEHRALLMKAIYYTIVERVNEGYISDKVVMKIVEDRWGSGFFERIDKAGKQYLNEYGRIPPGFVLISPTKHCNLRCTGCYASSTSRTQEQLDYFTVKKIIKESHEQWGARSVAISGGEPLMYRSHGKSIFDLACEFPYMYFKVYTNGTLITQDVANKMAGLANISPAISIEGTENDTDMRRGEGVARKIEDAIHHLHNAGVPVGVSITATRDNISTLLDDSFYDYLFEYLKITYGWIFEYMPIGRGAETALMPTPEERKHLFELLDEQNHKKRFICDFWSTSPSSEGCIAAGRSFGYLYINWNGDVIPCVFNPYSDTNILKVFQSGGTLTDAVERSKLFLTVRNWQNTYGFQQGSNAKNYMTPCPIRDHYSEYRTILDETDASPIDNSAAIALSDKEYYKSMVRYEEEVKNMLDPVWDNRFCGIK